MFIDVFCWLVLGVCAAAAVWAMDLYWLPVVLWWTWKDWREKRKHEAAS